MPSVDQSRLDLARAVGLLRMKERLPKTASAAQIAALEDLIKNLPAGDLAKAKEALDFESKNKPDQGPIVPIDPKEKPPPYMKLGDRQETKPVDMTVKSDDVAALLSDSPTSSFAKVYSVFFDYENEEDPKKKQKLLQTFERRAERWVNEHKGSKRQLDVDRSNLLAKAIEQASFEQARVSKGEAETRYMANIAKSTPNKKLQKYDSKDPDERYAFKALTTFSIKDVKDNVVGKQKPIPNPYGLTDAEIAAIRIFTNKDYGYINPATANSPGWLQAKIDKQDEAFERSRLENEEYMSEGVVHAGVAVSGLLKLPAYGDVIYRGVATTQVELKGWVQNGYRCDAMGSASTSRQEAEGFAFKEADDNKPLQVIMVLHDADGRQVSDISVSPNEKEVTILPGSQFNHRSLKKLDDQPKVKGGAVWELVLDKA